MKAFCIVPFTSFLLPFYFLFTSLSDSPFTPLLTFLYKAKLVERTCHHQQLFGSLAAEVPEGEVLGVARAVEGRVERTVVPAVHVDVHAEPELPQIPF